MERRSLNRVIQAYSQLPITPTTACFLTSQKYTCQKRPSALEPQGFSGIWHVGTIYIRWLGEAFSQTLFYVQRHLHIATLLLLRTFEGLSRVCAHRFANFTPGAPHHNE